MGGLTVNQENFSYKNENDMNIFVYKWLPDDSNSIRGAVQVAHGRTAGLAG